MSISERVTQYVGDKRWEWRFHSTNSHNRVLGKGVWQKIVSKALADQEVRVKFIKLHDHRASMTSDDEWYRYVGGIAHDCPQLPKEARLLWVIDELYRRVPQ